MRAQNVGSIPMSGRTSYLAAAAVLAERDHTRTFTPEEVERVQGLALGAAAVGAVAIGALAIGRLAVGRLVINKARIKALQVDELTVGSLRVREPDRPNA